MPQIKPHFLEFLKQMLLGGGLVCLIMVFGWLSAYLFYGCKPKPKSQSAQIHIEGIDSARTKLEINVEGANNTVIVSQETSQSAVTDYEKAKKKFDQSRVDLPARPAH